MTARDDDPKLHRIEVKRDADGEVVSVRFVCDGGDDAPCHRWPDCGCETWGESYHYDASGKPLPGHEDVQQKECWMDPWFNATTSSPLEFAELHTDEEITVEDLRSAPVSCTFEGDYMTWEYAEDPA